MTYLVSACLCGMQCRYDGQDNYIEAIDALMKNGQAVAACPEMLGGLKCPRDPVELVWQAGEYRAFSQNGEDVTNAFRCGAEETLEIARRSGVKKAILKAKSPSCGVKQVYDGTFSRTLRAGSGMAAQLLISAGIEVVDEVEYLSNLVE